MVLLTDIDILRTSPLCNLWSLKYIFFESDFTSFRTNLAKEKLRMPTILDKHAICLTPPTPPTPLHPPLHFPHPNKNAKQNKQQQQQSTTRTTT